MSTENAAQAGEITEQIRAGVEEIWSGLLEIDDLAGDDDFFELGGHSLLAIKMRAGIERRFGVQVELADLFERSSLHETTELVLNGLYRQVA